MSFVQMLPEELRQPDKKEDVIIFLNKLPIRFHAKKYTLLEWAEEQEQKLVLEDIQKLGGPF